MSQVNELDIKPLEAWVRAQYHPRNIAGWSSWSARRAHNPKVVGSNPTPATMKFLKFTLIWISQQLAIPFWIVGHIHLSIHNFHDLYEILSSIGMNIIVAIGFLIDYKQQKK